MQATAFEKKIWLSSPTMHGDELKYVAEAYETNWMSTVGVNINEVERVAAEKAQMKYAVALSCCTAALHLAVKLAGVKPDGNAISFNGNKTITGSAGGMLLTDDLEAANRARKWSTQSRENAPWYQHEEVGYNYRMST